MKNGFIAATSLLAVGLVLGGCSSSMVTKNQTDKDSGITSVVEASLKANDAIGDDDKIKVETREGIVHLNGVVATDDIRREANRVAWRTTGVEGVMNDLTVGERTVGDWTDDVMISSTVKSKLISDSGIKAGDIDVSSSKGVVTLIGRVGTDVIKTDAEKIARDTKGVSSVNNELTVGKSGR